MIFYRVVGPTLDVCSYDGPLVALHTVKDKKDPLFFLTPLIFLDGGVKMVMPSLTALLTNTTFQRTSDMSPLLRSFVLHEHKDFLVFFFSPGSLNKTGV